MKKKLLTLAVASLAFLSLARADRSITTTSGSSTVTVTGVTAGAGVVFTTNNSGIIISLSPSSTYYAQNGSTHQTATINIDSATIAQINASSETLASFIVKSLNSGTSIYTDCTELPINGGFGPQATDCHQWLQGNDTNSAYLMTASTSPRASYSSANYSQILLSAAAFIDLTVNDQSGQVTYFFDFSGLNLADGKKILFSADDGSGTVSLKAPSTVSNSFTMVLPSTWGASGNMLTSDGAGNLVFTSTFSSTVAISTSIKSSQNPGTYLNFYGGNAHNGLQWFNNNILAASVGGNGDFELYPDTSVASAFLQGTNSAGQMILQARPATLPWQLGSSTFKWTWLYVSSGIAGTTTNDEAPAGAVAEWSTGTYVGSYANSAPSNQYTAFSTVTIPSAGDWMVCGTIQSSLNGATMTRNRIALSLFSGNTTTDQATGKNDNDIGVPTAASNVGQQLCYRFETTAASTVYVKAAATFSAGQPQFLGFGWATRRR